MVGELFVKLDLDSAAFTKALETAKKTLESLSKDKGLKFNLGSLKDEIASQLKDVKGLTIDVGVNVNKDALGSLAPQLEVINNRVRESTSLFNGFGDVLRMAASVAIGNLLSQGIQGVADGIKGAISTAADFQAALSSVAAVAGGLSDTQLEQLREKALEIGAQTSLSAGQAVEAFENLIANGVKVDEQFNAITDSTVALSEATGSNLATAANVVTDVIQNFAGAGNDLQGVINGITGVTIAGKFDINDYALALSNGGVAVAGYGVELKDFNAVLAAISPAFNSGQTAGTAFRAFIERLTPASKEAEVRMRELGIITKDGTNAFYDSTGALKSQVEVFAILEKSFAGLTEKQKAETAELLFGAAGANVLTAALRVGSEGLQEYSDQIEGINAAEIAATRLDNFNGAVSGLQGTIEVLAIKIGDMLLPGLTDIVQGMSAVVGAAITVVDALNGNEEAFNSLSPTMQTIVTVLQDVIAAFQTFVSEIATSVQSGIEVIASFFDNLIGNAFGWGSSAGNEFAAGVYSAIDGVVSAMQEIGNAMSYWMAPGSPPRIAPDIDKWGEAAGQEFIDGIGKVNTKDLINTGTSIIDSLIKGFNKGQLDDIQDFGSNVTSILKSIQDIGGESEGNVLEQIIGSKQAFSEAINEFESVGSVSEATFTRIRESAGNAGIDIEELSRDYFALQTAINNTLQAQKALTAAQDRLNAVQEAFNAATSENREALEDVNRQIQLKELDMEIAKQRQLANAVGGTGEIQAAAALELEKLLLERAILVEEINFDPAIDAANEEVAIAQEQVDEALRQQEIAQEQYDLTIAQLDAQKENNALIKQQIELMQRLADEAKKAAEEQEESKSGGGGGGSSAPEIDKDKEAQERYAFSIADTATKLQMLRDKLAGVKEGSAEYYQILGQIDTLEKKQADEQEKIAEQLEKDAKAKIDAERDYRYSIADTSGKLAILRDELGKVEQGSVEYYRIASQIAQLENQQRREAERAAGGAGGSGGLGARVPVRPPTVPGTAPSDSGDAHDRHPGEAVTESMQDIQTRIRNGIAAINGQMNSILAPITGAFMMVFTTIANGWANLQIPVMNALDALGAYFTSIGGIFLQFWSENGAQITAFFQTTWTQISQIIGELLEIILTIITGVFNTVAGFLTEHRDFIVNILTAGWNVISNVVTTVLGVIQGIISTVLALIQGRWSDAWNAISATVMTLLTGIGEFIMNQITFIASFFGVTVSDMQEFWQTAWSSMQAFLNTTGAQIWAFLSQWFTDISEGLSEAIIVWQDAWNTVWAWLKDKASEIGASILSYITTMLASVATEFNKAVTKLQEEWSKLSELPTKISTWLNEAANAITSMVAQFTANAKSVGDGIIEGIKQGIEDGIEGLKSAAESAVSAAIEAAKDLLHISSPSKVMMEVGNNFTEGFAQGITDQTGLVLSSVNQMTNAAIPALSTTVPTMGNTYQFNIDARGSTMSADQFRSIIRSEVDTTLNKVAKRVDMRDRF